MFFLHKKSVVFIQQWLTRRGKNASKLAGQTVSQLALALGVMSHRI
jgi:hypothetical protein